MTKEANPKKVKKEDAVAEALLALAEAIKGLEAKIDLQGATASAKASDLPPAPKVEDSNMPFPLEWRMVLDEVLNSKFEAKVRYRDDARFELTVFVPKEYSNAKPAEWELNKEDRRMIVVDNSMGVVGVRLYAEKIAENLGQEIRQKINEDKAKLAVA